MNLSQFVSPLSADGQLDCFHFFDDYAYVSVNICTQVFVYYIHFISLGCMLRSEIAVSCDNLTFNFLRSCPCFAKLQHYSKIAPRICEFQCSAPCITGLFYCRHPSVCEVVSHSGFDLCFLND